jgi:ribosome-associated protein
MVDAIADKKGEDILLLDIREVSLITDYFILCSGTSERQLKAILEGIEQVAKKGYGLQPWHVEGDASNGWVLLDYGDIVIHIFAPQQRSYYDLESLWKNAHVVLRIQ